MSESQHDARAADPRASEDSRPAVTVRRAAHADARLLAEMGARTFRDAFAADNRPEDMAAYLASAFTTERLAAELADARSLFLVAEAGGEAVGYAKLYAGESPDAVSGPDAIELVRLYSEQEWLGRGVGAALMGACLDEARRAGRRTIWLGVWERNGRARAFYRRWGFREVGSHVFVLGSDPQTDVLMQRTLDD